MKDDFAVGLIHRICPICAKNEVGADIIMNTKLTKKAAQNVKDSDGMKVWSDKACDECQEILDMSFVLIGAISEKTDDPNNPYRSGNIWGIKKEAAEKLFDGKVPKCGFAMIDVKVAEAIGLTDINFGA